MPGISPFPPTSNPASSMALLPLSGAVACFPSAIMRPWRRLLPRLGQSRIANNLNQLARAANVGALDLTPELEAELHEACAAVLEVRALLVAAVGLSDGTSSGGGP